VAGNSENIAQLWFFLEATMKRCGFLLIFACSAALLAQSVPPTTNAAPAPTRPNVTLLMSVLDSSGNPITDLTKEQLSVLDNGQTSTVSALKRVSQAPLHLAIVLSSSKSFFAEEQAAASSLVEKLIRPNVDAAFVLTAGGSKPWPNPQIDWQTEKDQLVKTIQSLDKDSGIRDAFNFDISDDNGTGSRLWRAAVQRETGPNVFDAVWAMMKNDPRPARKAIVIFREPWAHSPGGDRESADYVSAKLAEVISTAQRLKIPIYAIGIEDQSRIPSQDKNFGKVYVPTHVGAGAGLRSYDIDTQKYRYGLYQGGKANVEQISANSGGRAFWDVKKNFPDAVDGIVRDLNAQYIFTFAASPEGPTSPAHSISLVPSRNGLRLDVPTSYFIADK
jgi:VWFA-related protein